jgi:hypothetical protein
MLNFAPSVFSAFSRARTIAQALEAIGRLQIKVLRHIKISDSAKKIRSQMRIKLMFPPKDQVTYYK